MLVCIKNGTPFFWSKGSTVQKLQHGGELVIVFDPSKTNMALLVGTPDGDILDIIEFSGNNRSRGPVMDNTVYCDEVRSYLTQYLYGHNIYKVAIEAAITKHGMAYHHSNMTLTEIRGNLLNFFMENYSLRAIEVNNWSWKSHTLPSGYRSQNEKGSKRYFREQLPNSPYCNYYAADVTDVICIYWYVCSTACAGYHAVCNRAEAAVVPYTYAYYPETFNLDLQEVTFTNVFSLQENISYYVNRMLKPFYITVPVENIDINDVYGKSALFSYESLNDKNVKVVVTRADKSSNSS